MFRSSTDINIPVREKRASDVEKAAEHTNSSELQQVLPQVTSIPVGRMYDVLQMCWHEKRGHTDLLLDWGNTSGATDEWKLKLFLAATKKIDETAGNGDPRETDISIAILKKYPSIIMKELSFGEPTALHMAAKAESPELVEVIFELAQGNTVFDAMLDVENYAKKTPLMMAMDKGLVRMTRHILIRNDSPLEGTNILEEALRMKDGKSDLLQVLIELRPGKMTKDVVTRALEEKKESLFTALLKSIECHHLFEKRKVLHRLVKDGAVNIMKTILAKVPHIALELDDKDRPALSHNSRNEPKVRAQIREIIAPLIIRQISNVNLADYSALCDHKNPGVSEVLRALLADTFDDRREISLSLGGYGSWTSSAQSFLRLIGTPHKSKFTAEKAVDALSNVTFEKTIVYVDIPVPDLPPSRAGTQPTLRRTEVHKVLRWLQRDKDVVGIYELSVRDSCYLPHDETIIRKCFSLTAFDIEVLNWRRLDLPLAVLCQPDQEEKLLCRNLKVLYLYAGGWPSLAYWTSESSVAFLCRFPKLKKVHVSIMKEFIGDERSESYKNEAEKRLDDIRGQCQPLLFDMVFNTESWSQYDLPSEQVTARQEYTTVEATRLGSFLDAYESLHRDFSKDDWRDDSLEPACGLDETKGRTPYIKVAVIDNGVDPGSITCHSIHGASFIASNNGESNWWYVTNSHGTKMARIITELNPHCRLLIAKVAEGRKDINEAKIVEAVRWAVEAGADIISISITLKSGTTALQSAIQQAVSQNIVVMASINGEGSMEKKAAPAKYEGVFAIGSADDQGQPSRGTVESEAQYLFPGEKLRVRTEFLTGLADEVDLSGPSVATAVAAGVASLVLACDRFALHGSEEGCSAESWRIHKSLRRQIVANVFAEMTETNRKYVRAWEFFNEKETKSAWGEGDSVLRWIQRAFKDKLKSG